MLSPTIPRKSPHLSMRLPISWLSYLFLEVFRARRTKRSGSHTEPYRHSNANPISTKPCRSGTEDWLKKNMIMLIGRKFYISGAQRHPYLIASRTFFRHRKAVRSRRRQRRPSRLFG